MTNNLYKFTLLLLLSMMLQGAMANERLRRIGHYVVTGIDTVSYQTLFIEPDEVIRALFAEKLDSMVQYYYSSNIFLPDSSEFDFTIPAELRLPDSILIARLQALHTEVPMAFNQSVRDFIEMYTVRRRGQVEMMLGRAAFYFPIFEEIFDRYNLPLELKYLAIIESALNPVAVSRVGATGLWQFMLGTARHMKMEVSTFVDERRDVLLATDAAARYLRQLYDIYGDWHLVIAAYNCGPGCVNRAIRRSGGRTSYWEIYYALPRETRGYVPAYIAATYAMNYYREHQLVPRMPDFTLTSDTIMVNRYLNFEQVASQVDISVQELRTLNPVYRRDVVPATEEKPLPLRIPMEQVSPFIDNSDRILAWERDRYFPDNRLATPATSNRTTASAPIDISGMARINYTVKSGDTPGQIARWYNVHLNDLTAWNNISRNIIRVGQRLTIYVPENRKEHYERINLLSSSAKQELAGQPVAQNTTASAPTASASAIPTGNSEYEYYTVRSGDNLWSIARKFPGISNNDLMRLNNITDERSLKVGQRLRIRPIS